MNVVVDETIHGRGSIPRRGLRPNRSMPRASRWRGDQALLIRHFGPISEVGTAKPRLSEAIRILRERSGDLQARPRSNAGIPAGGAGRSAAFTLGRSKLELTVLAFVKEAGRSGLRTRPGELTTARGIESVRTWPP